MTIDVTPHLNFRGTARQALEHYQAAFGGDLAVVTHAGMGMSHPGAADLVSWGQVSAPSGFRVMAYDVYPHLPWDQGQEPFFVSVRGSDAEELQRYWAGLAEGATVKQPLAPAQWAPLYGQLTDRFGVTWVLDIAAAFPDA